MKRYIVFLTLMGSMLSSVAYTVHTPIHPSKQHYFDTRFIANHAQVNQVLRQEGFQEVIFNAQDSLRIHGLYLERPHARYTMICCAGFLPGAKEGMAPIYAMLPADCNVLLFDARGHNQSEGDLFGDIFNYGVHEYKDIIGAMQFVHERTSFNMPIFIHGWCAGAYHAARAVIELHNNGFLSQYNVKGLILDSPWTSVTKAGESVLTGYIKEYVMKSVAAMSTMNEAMVSAFVGMPFSINYQGFQNDALVTTLTSLFSGLVGGMYEYFLKGAFEYNEDRTNLLGQVKQIGRMPVPVLYIASEDDECTPISDAKELAQYTPSKLCFWINKPSKHACHHFKHTAPYAQYMNYFINTLVQR